ncbi:hypothetical protein NQ317_012692 [Molorchus minor]|uniref:DUF7869 domain-containing protein n=1 Tax=Molorchus minor TaxID=1323400 RepID=A0ABQ9IWD0_9CUCU|nr:hypothetical protein NQ317_012692 [Molorchus minor]
MDSANKRQKKRKSGEGSLKSFNKTQRSHGKEYINNKKIKVNPKTKPTEDVICKCKYQCKDVPHSQKLKLFDQFYTLKDNVAQNSYLMGLLNVRPVKRRRNASREESHYGRSKSDKEYLSQDLNINRLYSAFKGDYPNSTVTYRFYYNIFKQKFPNLSFHHPRSDTCSTCDLLHMQCVTNPNDKDAKNKLALHHKKAQNAMKKMKEDHVSSQLPISDLCPGRKKFPLAVWKAVRSNITRKQKLIVWSDNCAGQNKNKMMLFLWIYLVANGYYQEINHKFLVSGHSFLSCDRDFAQIEKRKRLEKCEVPFDLLRLIATATPNNPFIVTMMDSEDFFDFKSVADRTLDTSKVQISKVRWIRITTDNPGIVSTKETFNEVEVWKPIRVFKKNINVQRIKNMNLPQLNCENHLTADKKKNIEAIIPSLKEENKRFFQTLLS